MQNNVYTLEGYSIRGAGSEGAITVMGEQDAFFRNRGTPKYIPDVLASGGTALTGSTSTVPIVVDGYNIFVISLEGSIALGSVVLQAQTRVGPNAVWENIATIVAGAPPVTLSFFRRRIRFVYTFGAGDAITYLSVYAVRDSLPSSIGGVASAAPVSISQATPGTTNAVVEKVVAGAATAHRTGITAADVLAPPGTVTCTKLNGVGSATAGVYTVFVVAGNLYGRTTATPGNATVTTETTNLGIRAAFAAVAGATFYDVYCSTDGASAKFVGRVTETQRASGIILTAVNTTGAGGTAGAVDIYVPGTGQAVNGGQLVVNYAFTPEGLTAVDPAGAENIDIDVLFSRTGDIIAPALTLLPFYEDTTGTYVSDDPIPLTFGGQTGIYYSNRQIFRLPCRGRKVVVVIASIAGTGASVTINTVKN